MSQNTFGSEFRKARTAAGKTLGETARHLAMPVAYLSDIERGRRPPMSAQQLDQACQWFGIDPAPLQAARLWDRVEKTLGQIGYEAYAKSTGGKTFDGRDMPTWQEILDREGETPKVTKAWEAAACKILIEAIRDVEDRPPVKNYEIVSGEKILEIWKGEHRAQSGNAATGEDHDPEWKREGEGERWYKTQPLTGGLRHARNLPEGHQIPNGETGILLSGPVAAGYSPAKGEHIAASICVCKPIWDAKSCNWKHQQLLPKKTTG